MGNNIGLQVYESLKTDTAELAETRGEMERLQRAIDDGRFSASYVRTTVGPERDMLKARLKTQCEAAMSRARGLVAAYLEEVEASTILDPAKLTDDVKLLSPGIVLTDRDVRAMFARSEGNPTMQQVILRYAREHKIPTDGLYCDAERAGREHADALEGILSYYERWIDQPNALEVLDRFFGVSG